ncbi:hypothetical protein ABB30_02055 [Stenotrophomonas ginsengisoli]|uniref:Uncharacterized protein n=1 Tax=Stenotrophomonas ginsengisoli TaxID=336566 RepID=A0A0R0DL30_9GAMM|nr:hypothetical protein ABB30_02055 [Stenotrophomonas ginsengisoli]
MFQWQVAAVVGVMRVSGQGVWSGMHGRPPALLGVVRVILGVALRWLQKTERCRVDITALGNAMCVLEIQQGTLHANAVDAITVQWAAIGIAVTLAVHHRLQLPDLLTGLAQPEDSVADHRTGCHALAMLWLQGQAAAGQVIDIVAKLRVVVAVHFHMAWTAGVATLSCVPRVWP